MPRSKSSFERERLFDEADGFPFKTLEDSEVKSLAERIVKGEIFTDRHVDPSSRENLLPMIFLPLSFMGGDPESLGALAKTPPGMIYSEMSAASPRSINGYPIFFSCAFLSQEDARKVFEKAEQIQEAINSV